MKVEVCGLKEKFKYTTREVFYEYFRYFAYRN